MNAPFNRSTGPRHHADLTQGSDEWLAARCGLLTASEMKLIITPTLKAASNDKERAHLYELLAQRISGYVEPSYISDDMLRGMDDEAEARRIYAETFAEAPVKTIGFITNDKFGFTIGYSPDALVGDDGLIECKSRRQKYQVQTIVENVGADEIPAEFLIQVQTGLLVSERTWCDFVSYSGGLPMAVVRVHAIPHVQDAIIDAASEFEARLAKKLAAYHEAMASDARLIPTERRIIQEMYA
jgi:predicted phage-related endonuclease